MSADIQRARDVLAKWRELIYDTAWEIDTNEPFSSELVGLFVPADREYAVKFEDGQAPHISVARLIVGTAGNPDLLDAIDGFLSMVASGALRDRQQHAERIAAAVISADERMSA